VGEVESMLGRGGMIMLQLPLFLTLVGFALALAFALALGLPTFLGQESETC